MYKRQDVTIAADLVTRIDDDHPLLLGQYAGHLAQHRCLAHARPTEDEDAVPFGDDVFQNLNGAIDGAADAARQTDDLAAPIANAGDAVQRAGCLLYTSRCV